MGTAAAKKTRLNDSLHSIQQEIDTLPPPPTHDVHDDQRQRQQQPRHDQPPPSSTTTTPVATSRVHVTVGNTHLLQTHPDVLEQITNMTNAAYTLANRDMLSDGETYERLSVHETLERLRMGNDEPRANRVLHLAWRDGLLVGCCSSTYQTPWCARGCGHWGLMVVLPAAQGTGVASALARAAERRLAGLCSRVQIEYEYTPGHEHSERLLGWYEGSCGFECVSGRPRPSRGAHFRKCLKDIPESVRTEGRREYLHRLRACVLSELECAADGD